MAAKNIRSDAELGRLIEKAVDAAQGFGPGRETSFSAETVAKVARRAAYHAVLMAGCLDNLKAEESRNLEAKVADIRRREHAWKAARRSAKSANA